MSSLIELIDSGTDGGHLMGQLVKRFCGEKRVCAVKKIGKGGKLKVSEFITNFACIQQIWFQRIPQMVFPVGDHASHKKSGPALKFKNIRAFQM